MYSKTSNGVRVTVEPKYLDDESDPTEPRFFWAYTVAIENGSDEPIQILARHWVITDQNGRVEDVRGLGVVGEQPVIKPGARFTYTSGCPLPTPSGIMVGTYQAIGADGDMITIAIPAFSLDLPDARPVLN
ncbi:Co2+/Mg2+ efflux protein ApaG [Propylenella binzhouense]|uniref:Protein ApaG n=1 Tax=Propylenella binzhouense TaxID=2555902 RepID=A0A964T6Z4_9HYPH|nr:Co2+/Mg2+ efflux protein ApaG [Propylenella binzhouense]MYZ49255.1 Co2+/Mg2+ efflux protein ApaG [Propylenella binzhouense]